MKVFYTIPGLSVNPKVDSPQKILQNLVSTDLKVMKHIVIWRDVFYNSISRHDSNNFHALSASKLIEIVDRLQRKVSALVSLPPLPIDAYPRRFECSGNRS